MDAQLIQESYKDFLVFIIDKHQYALSVSCVERVVMAVEVMPLPKAPEIVLGVINVHGRIVPVFNLRKRFCLPEREIDISDHIIIAYTLRRTVALVTDSVNGILEHSAKEVVQAGNILPEMEYVDGVIKLKDGLVLIHNLNKFLSFKEEEKLDNAIREAEVQK